jgi:uncharacterized protein (UPF0332 family)
MEGTDFLDLAAFLAAQNRNEAARRTAVSRAYYAAFHFARAYLKDLGVAVPANASGHEFIVLRLENCGHAEAYEAGALLSDVRSERNRADYDLTHRSFDKIEGVRAVIERASEVQRLLVSFASEPTKTQIRDGIARYHQLVRYTG